MADIEWRQGSDKLTGFGYSFQVSCKVRSELNGLRAKDNIFYTTDQWGHWPSIPSQPRIFPAGHWRILGFRIVSETEDPKHYKRPYFFRTDAHQSLWAWEVKNGIYVKKMGYKVEDYAYGIHYSESEFTQGCIRMLFRHEIELFAKEFMRTMGEIADPAQKWLSLEIFPA